MTDITELAQRMKAAAESVIKNHDCEWFETGRQICTVHKSKVNLISMANPSNIIALVEALEKAQKSNEFLKGQLSELANFNPDWDKLEASYDSWREIAAELLVAKERIAELESEVEKWKQESEAWEQVAETHLAKAIELESRTVTVKLASRRLPSDYVDGEFGNDDLAAIHNACRLECKVSVEKYLSAHGIVVKWEAE
ncbi:hypothetical protein [Raoultella lignicola]|uniref:Ead/Ea22-like family protein n=1 Tax=Raoultella lignicola TaxID=3040939 RepID=A0ABU9F1I6_9ENTR